MRGTGHASGAAGPPTPMSRGPRPGVHCTASGTSERDQRGVRRGTSPTTAPLLVHTRSPHAHIGPRAWGRRVHLPPPRKGPDLGGSVLSTVGLSLASPHETPVAVIHPCDSEVCSPTSPRVPWGQNGPWSSRPHLRTACRGTAARGTRGLWAGQLLATLLRTRDVEEPTHALVLLLWPALEQRRPLGELGDRRRSGEAGLLHGAPLTSAGKTG